jgi:hypothetical protein
VTRSACIIQKKASQCRVNLFNLAELIVAAERKEKTLLHGGNEVAPSPAIVSADTNTLTFSNACSQNEDGNARGIATRYCSEITARVLKNYCSANVCGKD